MKATRDLVMPEVASKPNANMLTPQSGDFELQYNKRPLSSTKSPRQEELVWKKNASEERFRSLVDAIQIGDMPSQQDSKGMSDGVERKRKSDKKRKSSKHNSRRSRELSSRGDKKDSLETETSSKNWGIKSVVSDNMDSWMPFEHSESEFSSNNESFNDSTSVHSSDVDLLMQTPKSLMNRPSLNASSGNTDFSSSSKSPNIRPHPSLRHLVVMDSGTSRTSPSSSRRRKKKSSRGEKSPHESDPTGRQSMKSDGSSSINLTPSVIAAGVQHVAARFDVNMQQSSHSSSQEKGHSEFLEDDNSVEMRKEAFSRSANRRSKASRRRRKRFSPEGIEFVTGEDHETMSTISYDPVLDLLASSKAREDARERQHDGADASLGFNQVSDVLPEQDRQRLLAEAITMKRADELADKVQPSMSLADVQEDSQEGDLTEDESPTQASQASSGTPQGSSKSTLLTSGDYLRTNGLVRVNSEDSIEVDYLDIEWGLAPDIEKSIVVAHAAKPERSKSWKAIVCKLTENPYFLAGGVFSLLTLIVVISVLIAIRPTAGSSEGSPSPAPTYSNDEIFTLISTSSPTNDSVLLSTGTPQGRALQWIEGSENTNNRSDPKRILQRFAMATLFFATMGEKWAQKQGWLSFEDECTWFSSADTPCDEDGNLIHLILRSNELVGELPEDLGLLSSLVSIELPGNGLFGTIPSSLQDVESLSILKLDSNEYSREFPATVTNLTNLKVLSLSLNRITGSLPSSLARLTNLEVFSMAANRLSSGIPAAISEMRELKELNLEFNEMSGPIRSELGLLRNLEHIKLDVNLFSRNIPTELGLLVNLRSFSCSDCSLFGNIPTEIGFLGRLETFELESNQMTGTIPSQIGSATNLRRVDLSSNVIEGSLPSELGRLRDIDTFDVSLNRLTGTVPGELSSIRSKSFVFYLDSNRIIGSIPEGLCEVLIENNGVISVDESQVQLCNCVGCHTPESSFREPPTSSVDPEPLP